MNTKNDFKKIEQDFQETLNDYYKTDSRKSYEKLWEYVYNACSANVKKRCVGKHIKNVEDIIMDTTIKVIDKIKNEHIEIKSLVTYTYWWVVNVMYNKQKQFDDKIVYMEEYFDNGEFNDREYEESN